MNLDKIRQVKNELDSGVDWDTKEEVINLHLWLRALVDALLPDEAEVSDAKRE